MQNFNVTNEKLVTSTADWSLLHCQIMLHAAFLSTEWHAARRTIERGKTSKAKICLKTSMKDV